MPEGKRPSVVKPSPARLVWANGGRQYPPPPSVRFLAASCPTIPRRPADHLVGQHSPALLAISIAAGQKRQKVKICQNF